jgi:hypothetical protein
LFFEGLELGFGIDALGVQARHEVVLGQRDEIV